MGVAASRSNTKRSSAVTTSNAASDAIVNLLGDTLLSSNGNVATADALAGKSAIGLYFSAHWCPPCRGFTPALSKAYVKDLKSKDVEIVFVSSDRDYAAFSSYFNDMPWLALPFSARKVKEALSQKYGVSGIPTLVVLRPDGTLVTKDGRAQVMSDPTGTWLPKPLKPVDVAVPKAAPVAATPPNGLAAVLGAQPFLAADGKTSVPLTTIVEGAPLVALYFSAHWCGPCRAFTPQLVTFVEMLKEDGIELPVIFGSSDRDEASFSEYFDSMPWCAFPHGDARIEALKTKYAVSGIPWLVVLDAKGNLVVNEADTDVPKGPQAYDAWLAKAKAAAFVPAGAPAA